MQQKYMYLIAGLLVGVIASGKLRSLPGLSSLPTV